jgi:ectoine hydroxylase-related dioxygenase (phytanoyl-CoA dioxygenase family)
MSIVELDPESIAAYRKDGYTVVRGLFAPEEVAACRDHYMALRHAGSYEGDFAEVGGKEGDPLRAFPRMIHMHRWDEFSLRWLLDERFRVCLTALEGEEPYAVQTMVYFKPPNTRGQALHQDQYYLRAKPGSCLAAWLALDRSDEESGCMQIVPGTGDLPLLCETKADLSMSFTDVTVDLPETMAPEPVIMDEGDVLFFNGSVVHGSFPNTSPTRFRRALIAHYVTGNARSLASYYHPILRFDGSEVQLEVGERGGSCGQWVDRDGEPVVEMVADAGTAPEARKHP